MARRAFIVCIVVVLAGCGGSDAPQTAPSGIEGIPLPAGAVGGDGEWEFPNMTYDEISTFFDEHLPKGESWRDWRWCEDDWLSLVDLKGFAEARYYKRDGRELVVSMANDDPPSVSIEREHSASCVG